MKLLNAYLDTLQAKIYEIHSRLISDGEEVTAEIIKDKLTGVADKPKMILEVFQRHNEKLQSLVGNEYAFGTVVRYETSLEHTACTSTISPGWIGYACLTNIRAVRPLASNDAA